MTFLQVPARKGLVCVSWHCPCSFTGIIGLAEFNSKDRLRILHLEDEPDFSELVQSLLDREGLNFELKLVSSRDDFEAALGTGSYDIILADYLLPSYNGLQALKLARTVCPDAPFLLVSGTIEEHAAIQSLKAGATDYVLKMLPERLGPAVRRAARELEEKKERAKVETELLRREKESEQQYRLIFQGNPIPMWVFDDETLAFLEVNEAAIQTYGYSREEFLGMTLKDIRPPEEVPALLDMAADRKAKGLLSHFALSTHIYKNGSRHEVEVKWSPISFRGRAASLTMVSDITEQKRLEQRDTALSKLGQSLSSATSPAAAAEIIRGVAEELFRFDAFTLDNYVAEEDLIYPILNLDTARNGSRIRIKTADVSRKPSPRARRVIERGAELILRKEPLVMPADTFPIGDESRPSASLMFAPIRNGTRVTGVLSVQSYTLNAYSEEDLTILQALADYCGGALERLRAEAALHASEMLFHSIWENSVDGMRLTDEEGRMVAVNDAFCKLVGMRREELEGQLFTAIYADSIAPDRVLEKYRNRFRERVIEKQIERRLTLRNGSVVIFEDTNSFVEQVGKPPLLLGLFRDVTAQKRLEEQLRQSQKMEAIGQLAGGVAHDFNNILTVIHGHSSLLLMSDRLDVSSARSAEQIVQAAERAAGLTRQLLTFSRRQIIQPRSVDLNETVANIAKMLNRILGEDITLQLEYASTPALVEADCSMMEQVLLNLAVNARDAMPKGGQLRVTLGIGELDAAYVSNHSDARSGRFVCLTAADNGCGIAPENIRRIFEPFFTTKEVGRGTGLGLATVYGIVKQHQGWIDVESELDRGTAFKVYLPFSTQTAKPYEEPTTEKPAGRGTETILVVEDEAPLRDLVCRLLSRQGYNILQAESGLKALEVWKQNGPGIDLVLTDLVMPDRVNGRELAEKLWAERPDLKVIFTSGYSADAVGKDFVIGGGLNYLQKPYPPQKLTTMVRQCLDAVN
jgi:PAS domain S-box-containing protein